MDLQPVLDLAAWVFSDHEPISIVDSRACPRCQVEECDPYRWADSILSSVASVPFLVVANPAA